MRIKRKSISLVLPSIISRDVSKKTWTQFEFEREVQMRSELLLRKQYVLEKNNCKSCINNLSEIIINLIKLN